MSLIAALVEAQSKEAGLPKPEREHRFDRVRRWRFDFAYPAMRIAIEVQGGVWSRGKHGRGSGIVKDYEKLNEAQVAGWRVFQLTPQQVRKGELTGLLRRAVA